MLIGLTGKARSGKDTVGDFIKGDMSARGYDTVLHYSFAAPLKQGLQTMFGWTEDHTDGDLKEAVDEHLGVTPRFAMQSLGTDWARNMINQNTWVIIAKKRISEAWRRGEHVLITDVRFDNEAQAIRELGGVVIHIERPGQEEIQSNQHASEAGVTYKVGDLMLINDKGLKDLQAKVISTMDLLDSEGA